MLERLQKEIELIQKEYGEIELAQDLSWIIIKSFTLPPGWNMDFVDVLIFIPSGYPVTPPDNFFTENNLRFANEKIPESTSPNQSQLGKQWLQFSFHVENEDWKPHAEILKGHNLQTFLIGVNKRLKELS